MKMIKIFRCEVREIGNKSDIVKMEILVLVTDLVMIDNIWLI